MVVVNGRENITLPSVDVRANTPDVEFANGMAILERHKEIAASHIYDVKTPYWEYTAGDDSRKPYFEAYQRGPLTVYIGEIGAFSPQHMATIVEGTARNYINGATFGDFPVQNQHDVDMLLAAMMGGFDNDRLIVSVCDRKTTRWVGGCMVTPGASSDPFPTLIGRPEASLSTIASLGFALNGGALSRGLRTARENQVVCYTRFSRLPVRELLSFVPSEELLPYIKAFSMETLSGMARATMEFDMEHERGLLYGILDTHDPQIKSTLQAHYGATEIAYPAAPRPYMLSRDNPLSHHYGTYQTDVSIQGWDLVNQYQRAEEVDAQLTDLYGGKVGIDVNGAVNV